VKTTLVVMAGCLLLLGAKSRNLDTPRKPAVVVKADRTVTLDVKDAEVKEIFKSMQKQCGIKNVVLDPNVQGKGTFYFHQVPCRTAFPIVLRTLGLQATNSTEAMLAVGTRGQ
jgi:type II secretory pathway component GspD/PulD (secretin)